MVRTPGYFMGGGRVGYEIPSTERFKKWLEAHPSGLVVDVGCSVSTYGLIALCSSVKTRVVAVDPDFASLVWTRFICSKVEDPSRLVLVHGFVVGAEGCGLDATAAGGQIEEELRSRFEKRFMERTKYRDSADAADRHISRHCIDDLLRNEAASGGLIIKIDVEGNELGVIAGAMKTLRDKNPVLLLSVHPQFGVDVKAVRELLASAGYSADHFASDHEEHWWCAPLRAPVS